MFRRYSVLGFAFLVTVAAFSGVLTGAAEPGANESQTQQSQACNYESLYDETIDSVVAVQARGGTGSGFVYQPSDNASFGDATAGNGTLVVTNAHVVGDARTVTVQFSEEDYRTGTVLGRSVATDLAVIRLDDVPDYVSGLQVADSDPDHGQYVAALGNPLGLERTITQGIVSGVNRTIPTQRGFAIPNVVQTDAAISPGNSGGPLVTCDGTVVGVNSAGIFSRGAENIGFAISPTLVQRVVPELAADGEFDAPYLGVSSTAVTPQIANANDLNATDGIIVASVAENSPASERLRGSDRLANVSGRIVPLGGDVILAIDGQEIESSEDLATYLISETEPGQTVELTVLRDGTRRTVNVTVGERPEPGTT